MDGIVPSPSPMAQGNAPHGLEEGRDGEDEPTATEEPSGRALLLPLPSLTQSHQVECHRAAKNALMCREKVHSRLQNSCASFVVFPAPHRVGNICREAVYHKLFAKACETSRLSMLFIGLSPQMPSCFSYRLIKTIK